MDAGKTAENNSPALASPKRLDSKGSAENDSPGTRRNTGRLGLALTETISESKRGDDDKKNMNEDLLMKVSNRADRRPSPAGGINAPTSILKSSKNSAINDREYALAKGGRFAAIYN